MNEIINFNKIIKGLKYKINQSHKEIKSVTKKQMIASVDHTKTFE